MMLRVAIVVGFIGTIIALYGVDQRNSWLRTAGVALIVGVINALVTSSC